MYDESALYGYWQCGLQQHVLQSLTAAQIQQYGRRISREECIAGKLTTQDVVDDITVHGSLMAVMPYNASCILLVDLQADGAFSVIPHLALPIFLRNSLDLESESLETFMVIEPPQWLNSAVAVTWEQQLSYAARVLDSVDTIWRDNTWDHAVLIPVLELCPSIHMDISLLNKSNKITIIEANRNSGKSTYAKKVVVDAWINAAVRCLAAPKYVWYEYGQPLRYATIFSCYAVNGSQLHSGDAHAEFMRLYNIYMQGKQAVNNWCDISEKINSKYSDKGGIYARLNQLHVNLKDAKVQLRHLQVLHSIWLRQLELLSKWNKIFDFIPWFETRRLQRLHLFFKQNFSEQCTTNYSQDQFEQLFDEKLRRVENSERFVADALHQAESDLQQENLIRDKCLSWCISQNIVSINIDEIKTAVTETLWQQVIMAAVHYWHEYFVTRLDELQDLNNPPTAIDMLIVEHAEYVSPMRAAQLLAISKRAIVMGNYNAICVPRFAVRIDYELTKYYGLASCDADFEDLQFDGKLASVGNMWSLASQGNNADQVLHDCATTEISYSYIDTQEPGALQATIGWLRANSTLSKQVAIYSCFSAHAARLHAMLQGTQFANIPIRLIQEPCFNKHPISLFLPVYIAGDPGPYVFDQGNAIISNLVANTTQDLIVIGDMRIFKPELHSASGEFAKHLLLQEEVDCV